jgi:hypothetical protein
MVCTLMLKVTQWDKNQKLVHKWLNMLDVYFCFCKNIVILYNVLYNIPKKNLKNVIRVGQKIIFSVK